ncbi:MAG TPA: hypothetical protein PK367_02995 [Candidatus Paceibacterota bacterium]|nr:hypothetical protein [Candidatus Paceibacterota bacterium]
MISESKSLSSENSKLSDRLNALALDNKKIFEDVAYYANPKNLEKILREKFNYRSPSEKMIIVVPE